MARILLVEDDATVRGLLREALERAHHEIDEAADGDEAIRRFHARPADVVITDIVMPGAGGLGTIVALRDEFPGLKIVAISGAGEQPGSFLDDARRAGADHTLAKPFRLADLLADVERLLEEAQ